MRITLLLLLGILSCNAIYDRITNHDINPLYSKSFYNTTKMNTIIDDVKEYIKNIRNDVLNHSLYP